MMEELSEMLLAKDFELWLLEHTTLQMPVILPTGVY